MRWNPMPRYSLKLAILHLFSLPTAGAPARPVERPRAEVSQQGPRYDAPHDPLRRLLAVLPLPAIPPVPVPATDASCAPGWLSHLHVPPRVATVRVPPDGHAYCECAAPSKGALPTASHAHLSSADAASTPGYRSSG